MARKTRKERKEEERRILAELDAETLSTQNGEGYAVDEEGNPCAICPRCRSAVKGEKCPVCGYKEYRPISDKTRKTVRIALGVVLVGVFLVIYFCLR
ncbi:MAG: hypothetical protein E7380_04935 [Clostridiales bacterium]|nr:hypothetical protein [Clostridiales bacterium]